MRILVRSPRLPTASQILGTGGSSPRLVVARHSTTAMNQANQPEDKDAAAAIGGGGEDGSDESSVLPRPTQSFVKARITPGEWDPARTDPLYRPKFTSSTRILSADDFAARPKAGTSIEFETFTDAMVTLSWLSARDQQQIYQLYCDIMLSSGAQSSSAVTSHEYAMRAVAQRFRITAQRVAAVVQLQHTEQQLKRQGVKLADDVAEYMDAQIQNEIRQAYQSFGQRPPDSFVEDPVGVMATGDSKQWQPVDDVLDVPKMWKDTQEREDHEAKAYVEGYIYKEDKVLSEVPVPLDDDCQVLLKQAKNLHKGSAEKDNVVTNGRWNFVAQTVNTRHQKKQKHNAAMAKKKVKTPTSYTNNSPRNTIVVDRAADSTTTTTTIRAGTLADTEGVAWKSKRDPQQFIYGPVQRAWLERQATGDTTVWGKAPPPAKPVVSEEKQEESENKQDGDESQDPTLHAASSDEIGVDGGDGDADAVSDDSFSPSDENDGGTPSEDTTSDGDDKQEENEDTDKKE